MNIFSVKRIAYTASALLFLTNAANASMGDEENNQPPRTPMKRLNADENYSPDRIAPSAPKKRVLTQAERDIRNERARAIQAEQRLLRERANNRRNGTTEE